MPIGDQDWLALTPEPTLEPELPICDPHHHLWEFRPEPVPYQRYLLAELAEDLHSGHNVRATVFIEVKARYRADGPEEMRPVGEVEFVEGLAATSARGRYERTQMAAAIIGYADLKLGERVTPVLDAMQAASPTRFRGVRHSVGWDASPELVNRESRGVLASDHRLRLACPRQAHRFGGIGRGAVPFDAVLHRAVRFHPVHVRKQLPGGQGLLLLQRPV
jgi:predicted TIM-barrel fold metal-dependent hydrolase